MFAEQCVMKIFVKVIASFECDGRITPDKIIWDSGQDFCIDKITDIRWLESARKGKPKIRYACLIHGQQRYLYYENNRWYMLPTQKQESAETPV